jgi:predicted RNA-binding Zn ribbon-like protein
VEKGSSEKASAARKQEFELIGGDPALDLVNTLDWRFREGSEEELITTYDDLLRFVVQCGLMTAADGRRLLRSAAASRTAGMVAQTRLLREAAARIFYAAVDGDEPPVRAIQELEQFFKDAEARRKLRWSENHLRWELPAGLIAPELPVWILSLKTAQLITSGKMEMLRACDSPECRWLFLDTSKNHTRRWCDMKVCGNRMKARRFKAQHH